MVTRERVIELLDYDPLSGLFSWKVKRRRIKPGTIAGCADRRGYIRISIDDHVYSGQRLAYLYMMGSWPPGLMDHRNCSKGDNRWTNLRVVDHELNAQNVRSATARSVVGSLGVSPPQRGRTQFKAAIQIRGKSIHLGYHATAQQAHRAYIEAKRRHHAGGTL